MLFVAGIVIFHFNENNHPHSITMAKVRVPQPGVQTEPKNRSDLHPRKIMSQTSDSIYKVEESNH